MPSKIVNGFRQPSSDLRGRIAQLLRCEEAWLFEPAEATPAPADGHPVPDVKALNES